MLPSVVDYLYDELDGVSALMSPSGGSRIGEGGVLRGMGALARREFLKTTPTFGQNLANSALNSFSLLSLAS